MSSRREEAARSLESRDWSGGEVVTEPAQTTIVVSARVTADLAAWVGEEAQRRGVLPSVVVREALTSARAASAGDRTVTVRMSDLHRAIDQITNPAA